MTLRIVVADDDEVQRKLVVVRLTASGYRVMAAADGTEALALIAEHRPDVVVSDVLMPGLDGFELCRAIRRDPALRDTPILLLTNSYVELSDRDLARRAGARDLILRTPDLSAILEALAEIARLKAP